MNINNELIESVVAELMEEYEIEEGLADKIRQGAVERGVANTNPASSQAIATKANNPSLIPTETGSGSEPPSSSPANQKEALEAKRFLKMLSDVC